MLRRGSSSSGWTLDRKRSLDDLLAPVSRNTARPSLSQDGIRAVRDDETDS